MTVFSVGGLNEIEKLPFRLTRDYRIDDCPKSEVVHDLEEPWEKEQRVKAKVRKENGVR